MSPETEDFLASVRGAEDPTQADERRVLAAVQATVAAGAVLGAAAATAKFTRLWAWTAGGGLKGGVAASILVAAAGGIAALGGVFISSSELAPGGGVTRPLPLSRPPARPVQPPQVLPLAPAASAAPAAVAASSPPASSAPAPTPASVPSTVRAPAANSARVPDVPVAASLRDELLMLSRAQAALRRGDAGEALRTLDAVGRRPPEFAAERATLGILALCGLGRTAEARRAAIRSKTEPARFVAARRDLAVLRGGPGSRALIARRKWAEPSMLGGPPTQKGL